MIGIVYGPTTCVPLKSIWPYETVRQYAGIESGLVDSLRKKSRTVWSGGLCAGRFENLHTITENGTCPRNGCAAATGTATAAASAVIAAATAARRRGLPGNVTRISCLLTPYAPALSKPRDTDGLAIDRLAVAICKRPSARSKYI